MKSMQVGWMMFTDYCRIRGVPMNGHHIRKLTELDDEFKENVTPESSRKTWAVNVNEADKIFIGGAKDETTKVQEEEQ